MLKFSLFNILSSLGYSKICCQFLITCSLCLPQDIPLDQFRLTVLLWYKEGNRGVRSTEVEHFQWHKCMWLLMSTQVSLYKGIWISGIKILLRTISITHEMGLLLTTCWNGMSVHQPGDGKQTLSTNLLLTWLLQYLNSATAESDCDVTHQILAQKYTWHIPYRKVFAHKGWRAEHKDRVYSF